MLSFHRRSSASKNSTILFTNHREISCKSPKNNSDLVYYINFRDLNYGFYLRKFYVNVQIHYWDLDFYMQFRVFFSAGSGHAFHCFSVLYIYGVLHWPIIWIFLKQSDIKIFLFGQFYIIKQQFWNVSTFSIQQHLAKKWELCQKLPIMIT